jgi:hypothetical protein
VARGVGKSQAAEDLWHLSISDLLAAPSDRASLAGNGPVVINLSTSTAHIGPPPAGMRHFDGLHLYQLRRGTEDQPQYLLRLGLITSDIEADAILSSVLEHYPGATKASPEDDDRAAIAARAQAAKQPPQAAPAVPTGHAAAKPASTPMAKRTEAHRPASKNAPATAAAKSPEPVRWDIDELLPDLAVTRPSPPKPIAPEAPPPAPPEATRSELPAPAPPDLDIHVTFDPPAPPAAQTKDDATAPPLPGPVVEAQAPSPPVAEATETFEITLAAPEPAAAPAPAVANEIEFNYDSDAITHEAPLPTFEFDVPKIEAPVPATPEATLAREDVPTVEVKSPREELPTIEVHAARAEPPAIEIQAAQEPPTIGVRAAHEEQLTIELPAHEEPLTIEVQAAHEELPTIEARPAYEEPLTIEVRAAVVLALEVQAPEMIAAEAQAPTVVAVASQVVEMVAPEPPVPVAPAPSIPAPAPDPAAETLEQLVAKIDAMVESVDQHEKERPAIALSAPEPSDAPRIDSTQTLRALTALELADDQSSPWFSIQLVFSDEQIDPEQVPDLDLFSEYRLYSVAGLHQERIMHSLRLGFFSSELAAEAVAGYLRGFFDAPCIKRVSVDERERFAEESMTARKDIGATGVHAVIELTSPKALPERQAQTSSKGTSAAQSSIWSRLVAPLRR